MEICAKPGMVSDGASVVSNEIKAQAAALGFRVNPAGRLQYWLAVLIRLSSATFGECNCLTRGFPKRNRSDENVRRVLQNFGRDTEAPWRAEQKLAALAAWLALR
jgi:hypothetical protein